MRFLYNVIKKLDKKSNFFVSYPKESQDVCLQVELLCENADMRSVGGALFSMVACSFSDGDKGANDSKEASAESHSKVEDLDDLTADNLLYVSVRSYDKENSGEDIQIKIYFDKRMLCRETGSGSATEEIALTEEQCKELQEYIADYSYTVKKQEKDYWPQTEEYPDGWNEFIESLFVY